MPEALRRALEQSLAAERARADRGARSATCRARGSSSTCRRCAASTDGCHARSLHPAHAHDPGRHRDRVSLLALSAAITAVGARLIERAHPPAGKFVEVAGGRLHVVDLDRARAARRPMRLPFSSSTARAAISKRCGSRSASGLRAHHRVILVDRPGHGWSERRRGRRFAGAAGRHDQRDARPLGIARAIVVAHSFAGAVATALALDHPARVAGLVLLAPVSHPWPGGIAWYYTSRRRRVIGPLFALDARAAGRACC